jgi:hypothetical protein
MLRSDSFAIVAPFESMKVFVKDARLRRHSVDVDDGASVAHLKLLLTNMSLVPAGFVPNLVYQQRTLGDHERIGNIGYSLERSISLICVRAAVALTAAAHQRAESLCSRSNTACILCSSRRLCCPRRVSCLGSRCSAVSIACRRRGSFNHTACGGGSGFKHQLIHASFFSG